MHLDKNPVRIPNVSRLSMSYFLLSIKQKEKKRNKRNNSSNDKSWRNRLCHYFNRGRILSTKTAFAAVIAHDFTEHSIGNRDQSRTILSLLLLLLLLLLDRY